jgi:SAM-dependent methyltransferase
MQQTPIHDLHNPDLLRLIPTTARRLVEVGCSSGALAREYRKLNATCRYLGIEIDPAFAKLAERYCDEVLVLDIEEATDADFSGRLAADCWVFGDTLEHLVDPWKLLRTICVHLLGDGCVVACIPNTQHWSVQARLNCGSFRYEDAGLLDRTHLRWFTRITMLEMFHDAGFKITEGFPRIFNEPGRERVLGAIRLMATSIGAEPELAVKDALPIQYVVKAVPR